MKYIQLSVLFLLFVFCTSCKEQDETDLSKETIKSETKDIVTSDWPGDTVLQIKKSSNGIILIASLEGLFRYDPSAEPRSGTFMAGGKTVTVF